MLNQITIKLNLVAGFNRLNATIFKGLMTAKQREGVEVFVNLWIKRCKDGEMIPTAYVAYSLATVFHETAAKMQPIAEYGKGKGYSYGEVIAATGHAYYGRGYVQTTWDYNYIKLSKLIKDEAGNLVDVYNNPDLLLDAEYSAQATLYGMRDGIYTGKALHDYLDLEAPDFVNARRVINGVDKKDLIAEYAREFWDAINLMINYPVDREDVKSGSRGKDAIELQLALGLKADGIFGKNSSKVLQQFQKDNGMYPDGWCGNGTWRAVINSLR